MLAFWIDCISIKSNPAPELYMSEHTQPIKKEIAERIFLNGGNLVIQILPPSPKSAFSIRIGKSHAQETLYESEHMTQSRNDCALGLEKTLRDIVSQFKGDTDPKYVECSKVWTPDFISQITGALMVTHIVYTFRILNRALV